MKIGEIAFNFDRFTKCPRNINIVMKKQRSASWYRI